MPMYRRNGVRGGMLLACVLGVSPIVRAEGQAVVLLVPPKSGRVTHSKGVIKMSLSGTQLTMNLAARETVKEVKSNGDLVVETADEGTTVSVNGATDKSPLTPAYTTVRDRFGKTKVGKKEDGGPSIFTPEVTRLMDRLTDVLLTDKPVAPNGTWQTVVDNPVVPARKITVQDTYLGKETVGGKSCWKLKQTVDAVVDAKGKRVTSTIYEWIDPANGEPFKLTALVKGVPVQSGVTDIQIDSHTVPPPSKKGKK